MKFSTYFLLFLCSIGLTVGCGEKTNSEQNANKKTEELPSVFAGKLERLDSFPSKYVSARNVDVWLPQEYDGSQKHPVLYMHDGQMLFDATKNWNGQEWGVDETISLLSKKGEITPCIVVGIWNGGVSRHPDYFPQKPFESLPKDLQDSLIDKASRAGGHDLFAMKVRSDDYLKFLVEELKPFIDQKYATKPSIESTFIMGSSMGGLISMYAICEYPEVFSGAACLSTHWVGTFTVENNPIPDAFLSYLSENLPNPKSHKIYFDYGTATLDSLYEPFQLKADSIMQARGFNQSSWTTQKFEGANHSEDAWKARLDVPLKFLLGKK